MKSKKQTQKHKGLLITFEGTEGAGKSTLIREVEKQLTQNPDITNSILITREPGGSPIAEKIRHIILSDPIVPLAELFLYEAARAEHMARTILPALRRNSIVLCDRFTDSALAYQSHARGLPWKQVYQLNEIATNGVHPNLTVLLDIDPATGLQRAREQNRFEAEGVKFQTKVRQGFMKAKKEDPKRWMVLSVKAQTPETLGAKVVAEIYKRFKKQLQI